jgi:hypothetical protein
VVLAGAFDVVLRPMRSIGSSASSVGWTLLRVLRKHTEVSEDPNVAASAVLVEKGRNEIATNWVKRP